jgi:hypothetical protein
MFSEIKSKKLYDKYFFILFLSVIFIFTFIYIFSLLRIINLWTFTEAHINYFNGFVNRGLFGTLMLLSNKYLFVPIKFFYSSFFYLFSIINITIFFLLIKKFKKNYLIVTFLILNPALLLFSFYDLGGYARFEIIAISSLLLHVYFAQKFYLGKISINNYFNYLKFIILPLITIFIFINEIIVFLIPAHIFISFNILEKKKYILRILIYFFLIIPIYFIYENKIDIEIAKNIFNNLNNKENINFWILEAIANPSLVSRFQIESEHMFTFKNIYKYILIFIIFFTPIFFMFNYLRIKNYIVVKRNYLLLFSILPIFLICLIARDWGRWFHLIIITTFCYYIQFPVKKKIDIENKTNIFFYIKHLIMILLLSIYLFSIRIPHCCNIDRLQISIYGGALSKIIVLYDMIFTKNLVIDDRFKSFN